MESRRRAQTKDELNLVGNKEAREIEVAKNKELKRQAKKIRKKQELDRTLKQLVLKRSMILWQKIQG